MAFLACQSTLPGSPDRRSDAIEHDHEIDALTDPCREAGIELIPMDWVGAHDRVDFDAAIVRTTWDYQDRLSEFLTSLRAIARAGAPVWNSPDLIEWNATKTYLRDLQTRGVPTIPTHWIDAPTADAIDAARASLGGDVVVKRQVGAGAEGQCRFRSGEDVVGFDRPVMVQPFQAAIATEGEWSFVFVDGQLSHALRKVPVRGDYRIQSLYGGVEIEAVPSTIDRQAATAVIECLDDTPLYARVDMVRSGDTLLLMELELIEPYLYPLQGPRFGPLMAAAIAARL